MWCVHVFSLSLFLFSLSVLVDLMYATSSTPGHVCLAAPTRGGWLVPPSLCLPTYLSGLVRSGQMPADSLALSFFLFFFPLSIFSLSHDRHGWTVPLPSFFISIFTPLPLSVRPPCTTTTTTTPLVNDLTFGAPLTILQGSLRLLHVCVPVSVSEAQIDELGKWNKARWSGHLLEREGE